MIIFSIEWRKLAIELLKYKITYLEVLFKFSSMDRQVNNQNIILLSIGVWLVIISRCLNSCQAAGLVCNSNSSLPSIWIRNRCQNRLVKNNLEILLLFFPHFFIKSFQSENGKNTVSLARFSKKVSSFLVCALDCFYEKPRMKKAVIFF